MSRHVAPLLVMKDIRKSFPGVQALKGVDFAATSGEVTALIGENGAGKSTLIKVMGGNYAPDAGEILFEGRPVRFTSPVDALACGLAVIHQELTLVRELSVAENVHLSRMPARAGAWLDRRAMAASTSRVLTRLGLAVDPWTPVKRLALGQQQLVEIARALRSMVRLVVMDEPTAALTEVEAERLFAIIRELKEAGTAVVFISHRLEEVFRLADRIFVLRDGENAGVLTRKEATPERVVRLMVGREVKERYPKAFVKPGPELLRVKGLNCHGVLRDISFSLRRGEILGLGGLMGAGQYRLARALFGLERCTSGHIWLNGQELRIATPQAAIRAGLGLLPENRKEDGLVLTASVGHNLALASLRRLSGPAGWLDRPAERRLVEEQIRRLSIKTAGPRNPVKTLSGGNQQKVVLGRWLAIGPEVMVMCEPTRGVDVGAKVELYRHMAELVAAGKGIILITSELPELLALSDRILVMMEGRVAGLLTRQEATPERVMYLATGGRADA